MPTAGIVPMSHIRLDEQGRAWVEGTRFQVLQIAMDHLQGLSPEEIRRSYHDALTLGQIHAALSFYHDHKPALDAEITRQLAEYQTRRAAAGESPFARRMREQGLRP